MNRVTFGETSKSENLAALKKTHAGHVHKRLKVLKLKIVDQLTNAQQYAGLHETSVSRLIQRYKAEGLEAVTGIRHNHGNRYTTREEEVAFLAAYKAESEGGHVIEVGDIHRAYEQAVGHPVTRSAIYYLLHKHGWRKAMRRSKHPKKASNEATEAYKKICETIQNRPKSQPKLRVMFQDEAGFGRINKPKRCWCQRLIRPCVPCQASTWWRSQ